MPARCSPLAAGSCPCRTGIVYGGFLHQPVDDRLRTDSFSFRTEVRQDPVAQYRIGNRLDILGRNVVAAVENSPGLGSKNEVLRSSRPRSPYKPALDVLGSLILIDPCCPCKPEDVTNDLICNRYLADDFL